MSMPINLNERKAKLTDAQRALFEARRRGMPMGSSASQPTIPISRLDRLPMSFAQQRLFFLQQYDPASWHYNIPCILRLRGELDVAVIEKGIGELVRRHEALRTVFVVDAGEPVQVIAAPGAWKLPVDDLSGIPDEERESNAKDRIHHELQRPFDLSVTPFRAQLVRLDPGNHLLMLTMHHIVSDIWSVEIFAKELARLYDAYRKNLESPLPELSIRYADYGLWQRNRIQAEVLERQLSFWKKRLAGAPNLELPMARPRSATRSNAGKKHTFPLSVEAQRSLGEVCQREGVTLFMAVLAAFSVLLQRYAGQEDVIVGTPISGRNREETEGLIGCFLNMLVLRLDLSGNPTVHDLLAQVREVALAAYENQDLPFERLVEELQIERDLSRTPIFQVMVVVRPRSQARWELSGLDVSLEPFEVEASKFDLTLFVNETREGLQGVIEYNTELFGEAFIERMASHFDRLARGVGNSPQARIESLPLLTEEERQQIVVGWNRTLTEYPRGKRLHELITEQARRTPNTIAVVSEERRLTYGELECKAGRLARYLAGLGVGREARAAICMDRSTEMMMALLGILKAGGAYVPLDPDFPEDRLGYMLEDSRPVVLLTTQRLRERAKSLGRQVRVVDVTDTSASWNQPVGETVEEWSAAGTADDMAYLIYTSGSTGRPKGVMVTHENVVNLLHSMRLCPGLEAADRWLSVTTLSFDIAALELYLPLITGAQVILASRETATSGRSLCRLLQETGATVMQATPHTWRLMLESGWERGGSLKILCGGEGLPPDLAEELAARGELWNMYGPTETTIWSSTGAISRFCPCISIGHPIANTQIYILDRSGNPAPVGVSGEICIGGTGVARGYWNRPGLTAERFIADPFTQEPGGRIYRTGDQGRWLADGAIECQGRNDHQIKIRGFRIELGEIEARLLEHPWVQQAIVIVREDNPDEKQLVAYCVGAGGNVPETGELRSHLSSRLPRYMVPGVYVFLPEMPLTANRKINRKALPAPQWSGQLEHQYEAPRTEMERLLCRIWEQTLHVPRAGIHDNFFDLGGHSLAMIKVRDQVQQVLNRSFPLVAMFEFSTIYTLAWYLTGGETVRNMNDDRDLRSVVQRERIRNQRERRRVRLAGVQIPSGPELPAADRAPSWQEAAQRRSPQPGDTVP